jgi:protein TonB
MGKPIRRTQKINDYKKNYGLRLQVGFILSLSIFILLFKISLPSKEPTAIIIQAQEEVFLEEVIQTKHITTPPPPPRPPVPIEVPNDEILDDKIVVLDLEFDLDKPFNLPASPPENDLEDEIFVVVEQSPVLIGGIASIQKRIRYPELAVNAGIEGRVVLQFIVTYEGKIKNPLVVRGIGGGCDEEALNALEFAKFKPGYQRGRPVNVSYSLPINFSLNTK